MSVVPATLGNSIEIKLRGESLVLLPEGALFWPRKKILAIADFHLGKAETFGQSGYALPGEAQWKDLEKLLNVVKREQARTVLFLGDLIHARRGLNTELEERFIGAWTGFLGEPDCRLILTAGNHDHGLLKNWPLSWQAISVVEKWNLEPFLFRHDPPSGKTELFAWTGHLHPCVNLRGGADQLRLKTFVVRENLGILPAFSSLAGGCEVTPDRLTRLYPIADGKVFGLGSTG